MNNIFYAIITYILIIIPLIIIKPEIIYKSKNKKKTTTNVMLISAMIAIFVSIIYFSFNIEKKDKEIKEVIKYIMATPMSIS